MSAIFFNGAEPLEQVINTRSKEDVRHAKSSENCSGNYTEDI